MATWPANAETDWNTKMLAFLAIGHDVDGTHNQEDWTPAAYTGLASGQSSITLPNGAIVKFGQITAAIPATGAEGTLTFSTAYPTTCEAAILIGNVYSAIGESNYVVTSVAAATFKYKLGYATAQTAIYWFAIGY